VAGLLADESANSVADRYAGAEAMQCQMQMQWQSQCEISDTSIET